MLDFLINGVLFWILIFMLGVQAYTLCFHGGIPNIRTAPALRRAMIAQMKLDYAVRAQGSYTIMDLGSGNGQFTRDIARALPDATVIGVERSAVSVRWARFMQRRAGLANLSYIKGDLFACDFSRTDAFVMYLLPPIMERLGQKLAAEVPDGTLVLSNKFALGKGWVPQAWVPVKSLYLHQNGYYAYRK